MPKQGLTETWVFKQCFAGQGFRAIHSIVSVAWPERPRWFRSATCTRSSALWSSCGLLRLMQALALIPVMSPRR